MSPFKYGCIVENEYFCPRIKLERQLQQYARDGQNLVIQGERRIGKTSLVKHSIGEMSDMKMLYIDLYAIRSLADLCHRVMIGIAAVADDFSFLKKAISFVTSLRPAITLDAQTGTPTISVDTHAANEPQSLQQVLNAIEKLATDDRLCVVFDEFQDILKVEDGEKILAEMRSRIQFQADIPYFFMGSLRNEMIHIFSSPDSPFFKSALPFEVDAIEETDFIPFLVSRFKAGRRKIDVATVKAVINFAAGVTGDVQELCKALWDTTLDGATLTQDDLPVALESVFAHESRGYDAAIDRLTPTQLVTLKTLARTGISEVCSKRFMESAALTNPSVVKRAINRLISDRHLFFHKGEYRFVNPFFREWLARRV